MCIVNIRRVYATNKNKVSIIIWPPTVADTLFSKIFPKSVLQCSKLVGKNQT